MEGGGWLWLLVALGTIALAAALVYVINQRRSARSTRERREQTTRENYRQGG